MMMLREIDSDDIVLRLGPRVSDPFESAVADAGVRGRQQAVRRIAERLGGFDVGGLAQSMDCKAPLLIDVSPAFLTELDGAAAVDACLRSMDATDGHSRLADGTRGRIVPGFEDVYPADTKGAGSVTSVRSFAVRELLTQGTTLVVNNLVPRMGGSLRTFINDLDRALAVPAQVNLYLSEREAPGFGCHWDDHDVLIIQMKGRKQWTLFEPTALSPRIGATPAREFGSPIFSIILEPGMGLFIPRGWGHEVRGFEDELSMHYTVGMRFPTAVEVLAVARRMRPPAELAAPTSTVTLPDSRLTIDRSMIEHAIGDYRRAISTTPANGIVEIFDAVQSGFADKAFRAPLPGGPIFFDPPAREAGSLGFAAGGYLFQAELGARDLLVDLFAGCTVPVTGFEDAARTAALMLLAKRGILDMVDALTADRLSVRVPAL